MDNENDKLFDMLDKLLDNEAIHNSAKKSDCFDIDSLLDEDKHKKKSKIKKKVNNFNKGVNKTFGSRSSSSRISLLNEKIDMNSWIKNEPNILKKNSQGEIATKSYPVENLETKTEIKKTTKEVEKKIEEKPTKEHQNTKTNIDNMLDEIDELANFDLSLDINDNSDESKNNTDDLNTILENIEDPSLKTPLKKEEIPAELRICMVCNELIGNKACCKISKGYYHIDHFVCVDCNDSLVNKPFYEKLNKLYCANDYIKKFAHCCEVCKEPVVNDIILSLGSYYHLEHFKCKNCNDVIGSEPYHLVNKVQYCIKCFKNMFRKECQKCNKSISSGHITLGESSWHPECFQCTVCSIKLENGQFQMKDNKLLCLQDYHKEFGTICFSCNLPIVGNCVQSRGHSYHSHHFLCFICKTELLGKSYKIINDCEYCQDCSDANF